MTYREQTPSMDPTIAFKDTTLINKVKYRVKTENPKEEKTKIVKAENEKGEKAIILKGPLSEVFYRALNILYAKDDARVGKNDTTSLESLITGMPLFINYTKEENEVFPQTVKIMGYKASELKAVDINEMVEEFKQTDKDELLKLVIHPDKNEALSQEAYRLKATVESLGIKTYTSLEDALGDIIE